MTIECCSVRGRHARLYIFVAALLLSTINFQPSTFGQGSLTPPGAPAPTMKTLAQVEPRTIVNATNTPGNATNTFIISQSGSYYLTANITGASGKHGISIQADDVTLDLNGFALISGGGGVFRGVNVPAAKKNLCVRNGTVRGWTDGGVRTDLATSTLVEKLRLSDNTGAPGLAVGNGSVRDCVAAGNGTGFNVENGTEIKDCAATGNGDGFVVGERAQVISCISTENTGVGFNCANFVTLIDCTSSRNFGSAGIVVLGSCTVVRCNASRNIPNGNGISAGQGCTVADCTAGSNAQNGIRVELGSTVRNCTANANVFVGISASGGVLTGCTSANNGASGISSSTSSITNCIALINGDDGIVDVNGVVAFCTASTNNQNNNGSVDIYATGSTRTGNNPTP